MIFYCRVAAITSGDDSAVLRVTEIAVQPVVPAAGDLDGNARRPVEDDQTHNDWNHRAEPGAGWGNDLWRVALMGDEPDNQQNVTSSALKLTAIRSRAAR